MILDTAPDCNGRLLVPGDKVKFANVTGPTSSDRYLSGIVTGFETYNSETYNQDNQKVILIRSTLNYRRFPRHVTWWESE